MIDHGAVRPRFLIWSYDDRLRRRCQRPAAIVASGDAEIESHRVAWGGGNLVARIRLPHLASKNGTNPLCTLSVNRRSELFNTTELDFACTELIMIDDY